MTDPPVLLYRDWDCTDNADTLTCEHEITDGGDGERVQRALGKLKQSLPVDPVYVAAMGRALHHFAYLEWVLLSIIEKMKRAGYTHFTQGKTAGCLARALHEAIVSAAPALDHDLQQGLNQFHRAFVAAKHRRDRLIKWQPFTRYETLSGTPTNRHRWPTEKPDTAAAQFARGAIEGLRVLHWLETSNGVKR